MGVTSAFYPELEKVVGVDGKATPLYLEFFRKTGRASSVVLTGDETTTDAVGDATDLIVTGDTLRCENDTLLRILGVRPDTASGLGHSLPIVSVGTGIVELVPNAAGAPERNRLDTPIGAPLRLAPGRGRAWLEYDGTAQRHRVLLHVQGRPLTPTFLAGDYTADVGGWTVAAGNVTTWTYYVTGGLVRCSFQLTGTAVTGTPGNLLALIPGGYVASESTATLCDLNDNGTPAVGVVSVTAGSGQLTIRKLTGAAFSTGTLACQGTLTFEAVA